MATNTRFGWHSGEIIGRSLTLTGNFTILGDLSFGDASADSFTLTGVFSQTTNGTADGHLVVGSGNLVASNDLARFRSTGSLSSTSNVVAIEQATGAGTAGAYCLYISATGANVEGLWVDAGTSQFDEVATFSGGIIIPSGTSTFLQTSTGTGADVFSIAHSGNLTAGFDTMQIASTGSPSSTSHVLNVTQATGAGTSGAYAVHISATGANVEGLHVDDGLSQFDEAATFSSGITSSGIIIPSGTSTFLQTSTGTGADAFAIAHSGNLTAGFDVMQIASTGSPSSTSHVLNVTQATGAGTSGAYALHVSATGANVEGLHVDDGTSLFDEAVTLGSTLLTTSNVGVVGTNVTAVEQGSSRQHTTVLTLTSADLGAIAAMADQAVGAAIYTLPAGAIAVKVAYMSVGLTGAVGVQGDTPDVGIGTLVGSGANAVLSAVGAGAENIITGQTAADANGTATVRTIVNQVLAIETGDSHIVYLNAADGWAAASATLLATGTVVLEWSFLA